MAREFKEVAMLKTDLKKYQDNWERIFGKKEESEETENQEDVNTVEKSRRDE
jgi:hypothetical protein